MTVFTETTRYAQARTAAGYDDAEKRDPNPSAKERQPR